MQNLYFCSGNKQVSNIFFYVMYHSQPQVVKSNFQAMKREILASPHFQWPGQPDTGANK